MTKGKDKLSLEFLILCDYALVSRENKLSILGIFDHIFVNNIPTRNPKMVIVGVLKGKSKVKYSLSILLKDPSGSKIFQRQNLSVVLGDDGNSHLIAEMNYVPFSSVGDYSIEILENGKRLGMKLFSVSLSNDNKEFKSGYKN